MIQINRAELRKSLRACAVAPNAAGHITLMLEVGDARYLMQRAIELVRLAITSPTAAQQVKYLTDAITILGIAKHEQAKNIQPIKAVVEQMTGEGPVVREDV